MIYDAVVTTNEGKHTYQNINALDEQRLINKIAKDLQTDIVEIEIKIAKYLQTEIVDIEFKKTFGEGFN